MYENTIKVPSSYFKNNSKNEYSLYMGAFIREAIQNGRDSGATSIWIDIDDKEKTISFENNGDSMSEDTLLNVLLSLGGTKKKDGDVGGFGQAKNLLYFSWDKWSIHTGDIFVKGSGPCFSSPKKIFPAKKGTRSVVTLDSSDECHLAKICASTYASYCKMKNCDIYVNGKKVEGRKKTGKSVAFLHTSQNTDEPFAEVFIEKLPPEGFYFNSAFIFVNGLFMFKTGWIQNPLYAIYIELMGPTLKLLTSNRDGLKDVYQRSVFEYLGKIAKEPSRILKEKKSKMQIFNKHKIKTSLNSGTKEDSGAVFLPVNNEVGTSCSGSPKKSFEGCELEGEEILILEKMPLDTEFAIEVHEDASKAPSHIKIFLETKKASVMMNQWTAMIQLALECAELGNLVYTPGFIWSDSIEAYYIKDDHKTFFLLNPHSHLAKGMNHNERLDWVMQCACHEVCHVFSQYHDEHFVMKYHEIWTKMYHQISRVKELRHDKLSKKL